MIIAFALSFSSLISISLIFKFSLKSSIPIWCALLLCFNSSIYFCKFSFFCFSVIKSAWVYFNYFCILSALLLFAKERSLADKSSLDIFCDNFIKISDNCCPPIKSSLIYCCLFVLFAALLSVFLFTLYSLMSFYSLILFLSSFCAIKLVDLSLDAYWSTDTSLYLFAKVGSSYYCFRAFPRDFLNFKFYLREVFAAWSDGGTDSTFLDSIVNSYSIFGILVSFKLGIFSWLWSGMLS